MLEIAALAEAVEVVARVSENAFFLFSPFYAFLEVEARTHLKQPKRGRLPETLQQYLFASFYPCLQDSEIEILETNQKLLKSHENRYIIQITQSQNTQI